MLFDHYTNMIHDILSLVLQHQQNGELLVLVYSGHGNRECCAFSSMYSTKEFSHIATILNFDKDGSTFRMPRLIFLTLLNDQPS